MFLFAKFVDYYRFYGFGHALLQGVVLARTNKLIQKYLLPLINLVQPQRRYPTRIMPSVLRMFLLLSKTCNILLRNRPDTLPQLFLQLPDCTALGSGVSEWRDHLCCCRLYGFYLGR